MKTYGTGVVIAALWFVATNASRADLASLQVIGPHTGTGFSNLGAVTKEAVRTMMKNADVLIELQQREGDVLNATCTAVFDFDTDPSPTPAGQTVLVAFPVTGFSGKAVKISEFEVTIDGTRRPDIQKRGILLVSKKGDEGRILEEGWFPIDANPIVSEYMGYQITWGEPTTSSFLHAYVWTQEFLPGKHCRVEVRYLLTLHAQSLAYSKKYTKGEGQEVVPFDAMVAGESGDKAFFLDYILRSGATWKGPIGHETVTLRAAPSSGLTLERGDVITFGRNIFSVAPYTADSMNRLRAGVTAVGIDWKSKDIVWEIDREKPNEDILMEIPFSAVRSTSNARKP